ncbi:MAG: Uma2 family endonuclease [Gemmataceae bacterium]
MATASTQLLTAEEFYAFVHRAENEGRCFELEEGVIFEMPPPGWRHGETCANIVGLLFLYRRTTKRGHVLSNDTGIILQRSPDTVRGPDVAYFSESIKREDIPEQYSERMPTLVVEVISPNDSVAETTLKLDSFLNRGAAVVWLVDPEHCTVTHWRKGKRPIVAKDGDEISGIPEMPAFRCSVRDIFAAPGE